MATQATEETNVPDHVCCFIPDVRKCAECLGTVVQNVILRIGRRDQMPLDNPRLNLDLEHVEKEPVARMTTDVHLVTTEPVHHRFQGSLSIAVEAAIFPRKYTRTIGIQIDNVAVAILWR